MGGHVKLKWVYLPHSKMGRCKDGVQITEIDPVVWKLSRNWKETRRHIRKRYLSKKSFTHKIYAGTSKAAHKVFQPRSVSSIRGAFPFL